MIDAGATTVNIPDTVGYAMPRAVRRAHRLPCEASVPNIGRAVISVHCHNDLGLAVANSLAAVAQRRRADRVHRSTASASAPATRRMEEVVMAMRTRARTSSTARPASTRASSTRPAAWSRRSPACAVQRNKAIVGENAFAHESGIHQDGVLKERTTYEIMRPEDVGVPASQPGARASTAAATRFATASPRLGYAVTDEHARQGRTSASRRWPTRRRKSSTTTSPPSSRTR